MFKVLVRLKPYLYRYRFHLIIGFACLIVTDLAGVTIPWLMKAAIDQLGPNPVEVTSPFKYPFLILMIAFVQGLFRYCWRKGFFGFSRWVEWDLRNDLFQHIQRLPISYFQKTKTGDLMSRLTNDLASLREFLGLGSLISVDAIVVITASVWLMVLIDPWLALWSLLLLPLISVMVSLFTRRIFRRHLEVQQRLGSMSTFLQENLTGIRVLKAYAQENNQSRHFGELSQEYQKKNLSLVKLWGLFWPMIEMFAAIAAVVVLWLGGRRVVEGSLTLGELVAFFGYLGLLSWPLIAIGYVVNLSQRGLAALVRLLEILEEKEALGLLPIHDSFRVMGRIQFQNVSFRYSTNGPWVLKNVSFEVEPGTVLGLVGEVGCGKSTIVTLLLRFYEAEGGRILIDGQDIRAIPVPKLRESIGCVPQDIFLFSNTLRDNIRLGRHETSEQEVVLASNRAGLSLDDRELVHGLDTILGERGVMLSGGQRQRVALARAILKDAPIVILDDTFSSIDAETERCILDQMGKAQGQKTTILISHRLTSVRGADQILYLKDGTIVEQGTHNELLATQGHYFQLFRKQFLLHEMELLGFTPDVSRIR
jgi:ATP-binding cassette subfamily B protein